MVKRRTSMTTSRPMGIGRSDWPMIVSIAPQPKAPLTAAQHHDAPATAATHRREFACEFRKPGALPDGVATDDRETEPREIGDRRGPSVLK